MRQSYFIFLSLALCLLTTPGWAEEHVVLQLKWKHAYQFAGYYMAKEKGYYRKAGLDVEIREGGPDVNIVEEVVSGRANYATGSTGILLERNNGKPVVVLGVIFQHSPDVLFVNQALGISHPQQLIGKTIMDSASTPAVAPMLLAETGSLQKFNIIPQDNNYRGLIEGKFDAIGGYVTDETYFYREWNFPVTILKPITYGVDFYGDNLFTSEDEFAKHPDRIWAFRQASFQGWDYAMAHPEETVPIIQKFGSTRTVEHLQFEYEAMRELVLPGFVETGYMNPGRWQHIADTYVKVGQLRPDYTLEGFLYNPSPGTDIRKLQKFLSITVTVTLIAAGLILLLVFFNRRLAQQKDALRVSEEQQRMLITQSPAAIAMFDRDMRYISASDRWSSDYHLGDQELVGRSHYEVFPEIPERWRLIHQRCLAGGVEKCEEDHFVRVDGTVQWTRWEVHPWFKSTGEIGGIVMHTEDITRRKATEDKLRSNLQRQDFLLSSSPTVIYTCKPSGNFAATYITPNFHDEFGYSPEEFLHDPEFWTRNIHPEDLARVQKGFTKLLSEDTLSHQYRFRMPDGSYHWVQDDLRMIRNTDGTPKEIIGSWRDINTVKYREELHRQNEESLKEAQRIANLGNWELNLVTNLLIWSDEVYRIFEIDKEKFQASYEFFLNLVHPDDRERVQTTYENSLKTQNPYEITHRLLMPDGRIKWIIERCQSCFDEDGKPIRSVGTVQDVSLHYNTRLELQTGRAITDELFANLQGIVYRCKNDPDWTLEFVTEGITQLTGHTPREFVEDHSVSFGQLIHPGDAQMVWDTVQEALGRQSPYELRYRIRTRTDDIKWVFERGHGVFTEDGQLLYLQGLIMDDTNRVRTEEELLMTQFCLSNAPEAVFWIDKEGRNAYVNKQACRSLGYSREELTGMYIWDYDPVIPRDNWSQRWEEARHIGLHTFETLHRRKNGTIFPVEISSVHVNYRDSELHVAFVRDITERKQAGVALRESEERFRQLAENINQVFWMTDPGKKQMLYISPAYQEIWGRRVQSLYSSPFSWIDAIHPDDRERVREAAISRQSSGDYDEEYRVVRPDGSIRWIHDRAFPVKNNKGEVIRIAGIAEDITKRKQASRDLELAHTAINKSKSAFFWINLEGKVIYVNDFACQNLGYTRDELNGMYIWDIDPDYPPEALPLTLEEMKQKEVVVLESRHRRKDGTIFPVEVTANYITIGNESHIFSFVQDISERKQATTALQNSEERYRLLLESQRDGVFVAQDYRFVFANSALPKMLGYEHGEFLSLPFEAVVAPDFLELWMFRYKQHIGTGPEPPGNYELRFLCKGGTDGLWVDLLAQRIEYCGRSAILGVVRDLTERRQAESTLRKFEHIVSGARNLISFVDRNYKFQVISNSYLTMFNKRREDIVNHTLAELYGEEFFLTHQKGPFDRALAGQAGGYETWFDLPNIGRCYNVVEYTPFRESDGQISGIIVNAHDITERKLAEEALRINEEQLRRLNETLEERVTERTRELLKAKEEAEQASLAKSQFLSRMSHELRTPMNAILGFGQLLQMELLEPGHQDSIHEILQASRHLLDLINELLDLSRIEAGHLNITLEPLNPATLVSEAVNLVWPLVEKKKLVLQNQTAPAHSHPVLADSTRLRQVLVNLLSNAAKYNKPGGSIRVDCTPIDDGCLRLSITDTGPGIAPEKQSLLFQPFERLGAEATQVEGAGIGLALSKRLVELMGGTIGMKSSVGEGSTFWLDLPRVLQKATANQSTRGPVITEEIRSKVLYVEDNAANLRLIEQVLSRYSSLTMIAAVTGESGLDLARTHHPDVILLDIHLPGIDGYEVLKRLLEDPLTAAIPVIAISADAMPPDIERGLKAGFRHYLTKPIDIEELIEVITSILDLRVHTRH